MKNAYQLVRIAAIGAPILILLYGVLRLIDVMNGNQSHGFNWEVGHLFFFIAFVLFGCLSIGLRRLVPGKTKLAIVVAYIALTASLFGVGCFLLGILGDLFAGLNDVASVPAPLKVAGPLLFQVGLMGLLIMFVATQPRRLPIWSPILVLVGFMLFAINLNMLPIGALILLFGLLPLRHLYF